MGIALNATTPGRVLGSRVTSQGIGQVSIRPMMPGESGLYSCDVTMIQDDSGRSIIRRKFYGVYVGKGHCSTTFSTFKLICDIFMSMEF